MCARDRAETCLGAILTEFKAQIDEIVGISKPDKNVSMCPDSDQRLE